MSNLYADKMLINDMQTKNRVLFIYWMVHATKIISSFLELAWKDSRSYYRTWHNLGSLVNILVWITMWFVSIDILPWLNSDLNLIICTAGDATPAPPALEVPATMMTWYDARDHCISLGKTLVTVNTPEKQQEIEAFLPTIGKEIIC